MLTMSVPSPIAGTASFRLDHAEQRLVRLTGVAREVVVSAALDEEPKAIVVHVIGYHYRISALLCGGLAGKH